MSDEHPDFARGRALFQTLDPKTLRRHRGEYAYFNIESGEYEIGPRPIDLMTKLSRKLTSTGVRIVGFRIAGTKPLSVSANQWFTNLRRTNKANNLKLME